MGSDYYSCYIARTCAETIKWKKRSEAFPGENIPLFYAIKLNVFSVKHKFKIGTIFKRYSSQCRFCVCHGKEFLYTYMFDSKLVRSSSAIKILRFFYKDINVIKGHLSVDLGMQSWLY